MMKTRYIKDPYYQSKNNWTFFQLIGDNFAHTLGFGDPPSAILYEDPPEVIQHGEWFIFIFSMFAINILILNTLIAILGDR